GAPESKDSAAAMDGMAGEGRRKGCEILRLTSSLFCCRALTFWTTFEAPLQLLSPLQLLLCPPFFIFF
ncbi:hypothetical protein, partial [Escherichia coli]|uniref:hypothetical protein n=1 Tax=Escherichia coli TaxID=562 RepID=UPI0032DB4FDE